MVFPAIKDTFFTPDFAQFFTLIPGCKTDGLKNVHILSRSEPDAKSTNYDRVNIPGNRENVPFSAMTSKTFLQFFRLIALDRNPFYHYHTQFLNFSR